MQESGRSAKEKPSRNGWASIYQLASGASSPWLREVDSTALQASVLNMDHAYKNFFAGRKGRRKVGFPKFKAKHHSKASYTSKVVGENIQVTNHMTFKESHKAVKLPKLGWVKARISTPVQRRILNATVSMSRSGKFFVSLCCTEVEIPQYPSTGAAVGLDVGIKGLVITSDGLGPLASSVPFTGRGSSLKKTGSPLPFRR